MTRSRHRLHYCCDRLSICRPFTAVFSTIAARSPLRRAGALLSPSFESSIPALEAADIAGAKPALSESSRGYRCAKVSNWTDSTTVAATNWCSRCARREKRVVPGNNWVITMVH
jgi:hypothetical protein